MKKYKNVVLGLDPSLSSTGFALLGIDRDSGQIKLLDHGIIPTTNKSPIGERLDIINKVLRKIFKSARSNGYKIEYIVKEMGFSRYPATTQKLFKVAGIIDLVTFKLKYKRIEEISPKKVKSILTGNGAATKEDVEHAVKRLLGEEIVFRSSDDSDAAAVALAFYIEKGLID